MIKKAIAEFVLLVRSKHLLYKMERERRKCARILKQAQEQKVRTAKAYNEFKAFQKKYCG
jgi:hypothetical protein